MGRSAGSAGQPVVDDERATLHPAASGFEIDREKSFSYISRVIRSERRANLRFILLPIVLSIIKQDLLIGPDNSHYVGWVVSSQSRKVETSGES